jgi:tape measure domain-containing protein
MATDLERLVVQLSADIKGYENALRRARGQTNAQARAIEKRFAQMNRNVNLNFSGMFNAFGAGVSLAAAQKLIDASTRITNALKVAGLEGDALRSTYEQLYTSAQKNAAPIETLVELYSRASLVQKELNVSSADLLKFTENVGLALRVAGTDASTASGALLQLSQSLGSGTVRAEEFNSILEGALPIAQAAAAGITEAGGSVAKLRQLVVDGKVSSEAFFRGFEAGASILETKVAGAETTVSQGFIRLQNVLIDAAGRFNSATDASGFLTRAMDTLGASLQTIGNNADAIIAPFKILYAVIDDIADAALRAADNFGKMSGIQGAVQDLTDVLNGGGGTKGPLRVTVNGPGSDDREFGRGGVRGGTIKPPVSLADYPVRGTSSGRSKLAPRTADSRFKQDLQDIRDRTAALALEQQAIGLSNVEQEKRRLALELEQQALAELREEARRKGETDLASISLSPEQVAAIEEVSQAYAEQAESLRLAQDAFDTAKDITKDVFGGLLEDLRQGASATDALTSALDRLASRLLDMALDALINKLFQNLMSIGVNAAMGGGGTPIGMGGIGHAAEGGPIRGAGSGTSDSIPTMLSNGEYVIRASQAAKHRDLLDRINYGTGRVMKMASGGPVGGGQARAGGVVVNNYGRDEVQARQRDDGTTEIIIGTVQQGMAQGRFNPTMRGTYGVGNNRVRRGSA